MGIYRHPETREIITQTEYLKAVGRHGCSKDPKWNKKKKRHECCGATRPYYHNVGCPLCIDVTE